MLERGREKVAGADADANGQAAFLGAAGGVLADGEARVDAGAGKEVAADGGAGALGRDHDDIHVPGRNDARLVLVGNREAMREVECVPGFQVFLHHWPDSALGGIGDKHLDDRAPADALVNLEQGFARHPAILDGAVPVALEGAGLANDDVEAVVAQVQRLGRPLHAVTNDGDNFVLKHLPSLGHREFLPRDDLFFCSAKIDNHTFSFA